LKISVDEVRFKTPDFRVPAVPLKGLVYSVLAIMVVRLEDNKAQGGLISNF
jgi:hypothetical protein